ncbi:hypothetical protein IM538_09290 [Cytobacillus suaedae]|nr:hypothetical protein IM538_09290 [Cytobacillus suaedae]
MKKVRLLLLSLLLLMVYPSFIFASEGSSSFTKALEERLDSASSYYDENSVTIVDSISLKGEVFKVVTKDNRDTPEDETETETYESTIIAALVEYQQVRDSIFKFNKTEIYYYDLDNSEFLEVSNVIGNPEFEAFTNENTEKVHKEITPFSSTLAILLILIACFLVPVLIFMFHGTSGSGQYHVTNGRKASY